MTPVTDILLFSYLPCETGWAELDAFLIEKKQDVGLLANSIVADLAERLSSEASSSRVVVHTTNLPTDRTLASLSPRIRNKNQDSTLFSLRVSEAVNEIYQLRENARVVVFYGRNPLYPPALLSRGVALLEQKDDVVVMGESEQRDRYPALMWIATKRFHAELFGEKCSWCDRDTSMLQAVADEGALLIPVKSVRNIVGLEDLSYLYHEIEREVLLKKWYPQRTYEVLTTMHRAGIISEM
jgi:hypothetical protein